MPYMCTNIVVILYFNFVQGVTLNTCEGAKQFHGTIATLSGDNPGSSAVTGFKESGSAFRLCRQCMATRDNFHLKVQLYDATQSTICYLST